MYKCQIYIWKSHFVLLETKSLMFVSVRTRAFTLGYNRVLNRYPGALQTPLFLQAAPSQDRKMSRFGRFAEHPLRDRTRPLIVAAPHLHVARPESAAQVVPRVNHRAEGVIPQPQLQPPPEFFTRLLLLAVLDLELHGPDLFGHGSGELLPYVRVLDPRVLVLRRRDGHGVRVEVAAQSAPELRLIEVLLLRVKGRIRILPYVKYGQSVAGNGTDDIVILAHALLHPEAQREHEQNPSQETRAIHVVSARPRSHTVTTFRVNPARKDRHTLRLPLSGPPPSLSPGRTADAQQTHRRRTAPRRSTFTTFDCCSWSQGETGPWQSVSRDPAEGETDSAVSFPGRQVPVRQLSAPQVAALSPHVGTPAAASGPPAAELQARLTAPTYPAGRWCNPALLPALLYWPGPPSHTTTPPQARAHNTVTVTVLIHEVRKEY